MNKKRQSEPEPEAGSIEDYIHRLIGTCDARLNDKDNPVTVAGFQYYTGAKNFLYMLLTGSGNPLANPKPDGKIIKDVLRNTKKHLERTSL
jgi:hypothetical protein